MNVMFEKPASHPKRTRRRFLSEDIMNNRDSGINPDLLKLEIGTQIYKMPPLLKTSDTKHRFVCLWGLG